MGYPDPADCYSLIKDVLFEQPPQLTDTFGQYSFNNLNRANAGKRPHGQEQLGEREGFFECTERTLYLRIIVA